MNGPTKGDTRVCGLIRRNKRLAIERWGPLSSNDLSVLKQLTKSHRLEVEVGDVQRLDNGWYVTHSGLLRLATRRGCAGIEVRPVARFCSPAESRWAFRATVFRRGKCRGFSGYGDADPSNVSELVRGPR